MGPDRNHHCHVHFEPEWFKCHRCGKSGSIAYLLNLKTPLKKESEWKSYRSTSESQKLNPLLSARQRGLETSKTKPGITVPIEAVKRNHPAWQYLFSEGFTENKILKEAETHGIYLCTQGIPLTSDAANTTTNRLIFDIKEGNKSYGWQARWLPSHWPKTQADLHEEAQVQKYLISPGLKKSYLLYNWTQAQLWDTWIIVEGIKKVWKTGGFALANFGISSNPNPPEELPKNIKDQFWSMRLLNGNRPVGLLYDKEAFPKAQKDAQLLTNIGIKCKAIPLPDNGYRDLDAYSTPEIRQIIKNSLGYLPKTIPPTHNPNDTHRL